MLLVCFHATYKDYLFILGVERWGSFFFLGGGGREFISKSKSQNVRGWGNKESTFLIHFVLQINTTHFPSPTQDVTNDQSLYMAKHFKHSKRNL